MNSFQKLTTTVADNRIGKNITYSIHTILMTVFLVFYLRYASFYAFADDLGNKKYVRRLIDFFNLDADKLPSDNHCRKILDEISPEHFYGFFWETVDFLQQNFQFENLMAYRKRILIALDGSQYFNSYKIFCVNCSTKNHKKGGIEYYHSLLAATIVLPGKNDLAIPLPPEFIIPQDGHEKQDCENRAAARWLEQNGPKLHELGLKNVTMLGDALYSNNSLCNYILDAKFDFILTCKDGAPKNVASYVNNAECEKLVLNKKIQGAEGKGKIEIIYEWMTDIPIRNTADALHVNWISIKHADPNDKSKNCVHSFITNLTPTKDNIEELVSCGRARWKIENGCFNNLKNRGYNFEHNFGHGKKHLASVMATFNLIAFCMNMVLGLFNTKWQQARLLFKTTISFLRQIKELILNTKLKSLIKIIEKIIRDRAPPKRVLKIN